MWPDIVAIFGGTGAILTLMGGCVWKLLQSYRFSYNAGMHADNFPVQTLHNTWEYPGANVPAFTNYFKRMVYATSTPTKKWKIRMKPGDGSVYVYTDMYEAPPDKQRFLRIRLKGIQSNAKICFIQKYWTGTSREFIQSNFHPPKVKNIYARDGVHTYLQPSLIGVDDVTKEQIGIHFNANEVGYGCVIEEAYTSTPTRMCNVRCCGYHPLTILYYPK